MQKVNYKLPVVKNFRKRSNQLRSQLIRWYITTWSKILKNWLRVGKFLFRRVGIVTFFSEIYFYTSKKGMHDAFFPFFIYDSFHIVLSRWWSGVKTFSICLISMMFLTVHEL